MPAAVATLRALISQRFPDAAPLTHPAAEPVPTGLPALDRILPGGGLPRSRLAVWLPLGGGSSILRTACLAAVASGERAAWIDGAATVAGPFWEEGPLLLRPRTRQHALGAAEELLRSGGFGLVVLTGAEPEGREAVRLTRSARDGGGALVMLAARSAMASLRLTSRLLPNGYRWRLDPFGEPAEAEHAVVRVRAQAMGWNAQADLSIPVMHHELRLSLEPALADRRGVRR